MLRRILAGCAGLAAALAVWPAAAQSAMPLVLQPNPAIRQGRLANGMRYAVLRNATPAGAISIRLGLDVGSYEEAEDELGLAHFVEHMAFNGTRTFPEDKLDVAFAALGVGAGDDQNGHTSLTATTFEVDLPAASPAALDQAFLWLRDVTDGMLFEPGAVDRERGVILAEREAGGDAAAAWRDPILAFNRGGLRSTARAPIGTEASVASATPERLRRFYDRWYRPENAVVAVVGDLPLDDLEARVRAAFADWRGRGPAGVRAPRRGPQGERPLEISVQADQRAPYAAKACRLHGPDPREPAGEVMRRTVVRALWSDILQRRLRRLTALASPAVLDVDVSLDPLPDAFSACVALRPVKGRVDQALAQASAEIERFAREGPNETEFEDGIAELRARHRGGLSEAPTLRSSERANDLLFGLLEDGAPPSAVESMRAFNQIVSELAPESLKSGFLADWSGWGPLLSVTAPDLLPEAAIRAAWNAMAPAPAAALAEANGAKNWPYPAPSRAGRVVAREVVAEPGFVRLRFANGVVLNFKQTPFSGGSVSVRVRFGAGRREVAPADYLLANVAAEYFKEGGLGRLPYADLGDLLRYVAWEAEFTVGDDAFDLDGETNAGALAAQLTVLSAFLTDPGFDARLDAGLRTRLEAAYRRERNNPDEVLQTTFISAIAPGSPMSRPPLEQFAAARSADFARVLKPALIRDPIEVSVVGDVDEATAVAAVAKTLGALPARRGRVREAGANWTVRFPADPPRVVRTTHEGAANQAAVGVYWPLYASAPERLREEMSLILLGHILGERLHRRLREELGKTYAPAAYAYLPNSGDQGYLAAIIETGPADLAAAAAQVAASGAELAAGGISEQDFETARKPMVAAWEAAEKGNDWWLDALSAARDPGDLKSLLARRPMLASLTLEDVRRAAAAWLSTTPMTVLAMPGGTKEARR